MKHTLELARDAGNAAALLIDRLLERERLEALAERIVIVRVGALDGIADGSFSVASDMSERSLV